jgi:spore coat protein I
MSAFGVQKVFREKGNFRNADSTLLIRKTKDSQISSRYQLCQHCSKSGYPWLESYYLSRSGKPYVIYEGEYYVMTDLFRHTEADFSDKPEFLRSVSALAGFHKAARGIEIDGKVPPLTEEFQIQGIKIDNIRKRIRKQKKLSDFDLMFVKNYSDYRDRIKRAENILESTSYLKREAEAVKRGHICHGALKENCLRVHGNDVYICKFESAHKGYQLRDLADLIRRREKKGG